MIIVCMIPSAGMGNQMFTYAAGLTVSRRLKTELVLDTLGFSRHSSRDYYLDKFPNITERKATLKEVWSMSPYLALADFFKLRGNSIYRNPFRRIIFELMDKAGMFDYGKKAFSMKYDEIPDNTYMTICWGTEKFFADSADIVREKFTFPAECFDPVISSRIRQCNSVALHVRRGDKVNNRRGFLPSDERYISAAIEKISALTEKPEFFVFSDDIAWCREHLPNDCTFVDSRSEHSDMAMMTICKHIIMAPSTFSWWAAWLNDNPEKIIIAPDTNLWHRNAKAGGDYLPSSWIRIAEL